MKCSQQPKFQPITIILDTAEEAEAVWAAVDGREQESKAHKKIVNNLSNWFCQNAQLLGS